MNKDILSQRGATLFPKAKRIAFAAFKNKYAGKACWVVGRGPTEFNYEKLAKIKDPIFFINDAVALEKHAPSETFFFAHDHRMLPWLNSKLKSTAVLPVDGKLFTPDEKAVLSHAAGIVFYHWRKIDGEKLLRMNRDELAKQEELYTNTGTIHSLLHFLWFCGFQKVTFIGCDGIGDKSFLKNICKAESGYDGRLENLSKTSPWGQYGAIRKVQDRLCNLFDFKTNYLGTPIPTARRNADPLIPKIAHFIWLGGPLPKLAEKNIQQFKELHPDWKVHIWVGIPPEMPEDLVQILYSTNILTMRSDIIRYWLLYEYGGIYFDADIYVIRNVEELRHYNYFVARSPTNISFYGGVIGAVSKTRVSKKIIDEVMETYELHAISLNRCEYGPDLIQRVHSKYHDEIAILPYHYFYIFQTRKTALRFIDADSEERKRMIKAVGDRITDGVEPYAIHTWGIPHSMSHPYYSAEHSTWEPASRRGDMLLSHFPNKPIKAAMLGVGNGRFAAYLLGHHSTLDLTMVDQWELNANPNRGQDPPDTEKLYRQAIEGTKFAEPRRTIVREDPAKAASRVPNSSLDWVCLDNPFSAAGVKSAIEAWLPKMKPNGRISGPANMPADVQKVVEESLTRLGKTFEKEIDGIWFIKLNGAVSSIGNDRFAAYLLGQHGAFDLTMVNQRELNADQNNSKDPPDREKLYRQAIEGTKFAEPRRTVVCEDPAKAAARVPNSSLNWICLDDPLPAADIISVIEAWLPKIKPNGRISGPANMPADVQKVIEEALTRLGKTFEKEIDGIWLINLNGK
jgi:inositol phosphorylceramide mannosyltransferase catalytic subunit